MSIMRLAGALPWGLLGLGIFGAGAGLPARAAAATTLAAPSTGYSAAELYNSANAYARSGKIPLAVLDYERARVLTPSDPDLRWNLHRVRESVGLPEGGSWFEEHGRFANPNTMYWIGVAGLVIGGGCLLALRRRPRLRGALLAGAVLGVAAVGASALNAAALYGVLSESVALEQAPAAVSPVAGADPLFQVPAASIVQVLDRHGGFELIRDSQGREGWVPAEDLAAVIPSAT